jgi:hypothetical protein
MSTHRDMDPQCDFCENPDLRNTIRLQNTKKGKRYTTETTQLGIYNCISERKMFYRGKKLMNILVLV